MLTCLQNKKQLLIKKIPDEESLEESEELDESESEDDELDDEDELRLTWVDGAGGGWLIFLIDATLPA